MCAVRFDAVEAGALRALCGGDEIVAQLLDLGQRQGARAGLCIVGRTHRRADEVLRRAVAGVVQLGGSDRTLRLDVAGQAREALEVLVAENAQLTGKSLADRLDVGRARHREPEPARRAHGQPVEFLVGQAPVRMALLVRQRRQHETVLHGRAVRERKRLEKLVYRHTISR